MSVNADLNLSFPTPLLLHGLGLGSPLEKLHSVDQTGKACVKL